MLTVTKHLQEALIKLFIKLFNCKLKEGRTVLKTNKKSTVKEAGLFTIIVIFFQSILIHLIS